MKTRLSQCNDIIEDLRESSKLLEEESQGQSRFHEALTSAFDEMVDKLNKLLEEKSRSNLELAVKLRMQEETTKKLEMKVAELVVQMAVSFTILHQKLEVTAEGATPQSSPAEKVPTLENVSVQTVSTQPEIFAFEKVSELEVIPELPESGNLFIKEELTAQKANSESGDSELVGDQQEIIPELPEPQGLVPSGDVSIKTVSLWRRFKKSITPARRRQYKSERRIQAPEAIKDAPEPGEFLQLEGTVVQDLLSAPAKSTRPEQSRPKKPSVWERLKRSVTPTRN